MKNSSLLLIISLIFVAVSGWTQGLVQRRWATDDQLPAAAARLQKIPKAFGHWTSEELSLTETEISTGRIAGYVRREYRHAQTESTVGVLLMVGEAGPISLHPPTVCLAGQGYQMLRQPSTQTISLDGRKQSEETCEVFRTDFRSAQASDDRLTRLYWGWSTEGKWQAATNPRFSFVGEPLLYKLYVTERWRPSESRTDTAVAEQFLKEFLPAVRRSIAASSFSDQALTGNKTESNLEGSE
ncbi:MAG: exosortase-associated EpsI family protein [Fuerstiella sp.]